MLHGLHIGPCCPPRGPGGPGLPARSRGLVPSPRRLAEGRPVYLQWVPSHRGIRGNDAADELAREAAAMAQSEAPLDTTTVYRAATRQARERTARDRPGYSVGARSAMGGYRELMGAGCPPPPPPSLPPISDMNRSSAVDVHQMRTGRLSGSAQFLHEIGRNPSPECRQCRNTNCEAARCPLCGEEGDTPDTSC